MGVNLIQFSHAHIEDSTFLLCVYYLHMQLDILLNEL